MTVPLPSDDGGRIRVNMTDLGNLTDLGSSATCVACGPGLGQSVDLAAFVVRRLSNLRPADGLRCRCPELRWHAPKRGGSASRTAPRILTPHPGEFARLIAVDGFAAGAARRTDCQGAAFARSEGVVVVLKGHQTFITDGTDEAINATGNPGMATGGTGDVLTGIITALVCQGLSPFDAAVLGAHVHGLAGDLAAAELGQVSLIASDLLRYLPKAFQAWPSVGREPSEASRTPFRPILSGLTPAARPDYRATPPLPRQPASRPAPRSGDDRQFRRRASRACADRRAFAGQGAGGRRAGDCLYVRSASGAAAAAGSRAAAADVDRSQGGAAWTSWA